MRIPKKSQKNPEKNKISNRTFEEAPGEGACVKILKMDPISKKGLAIVQYGPKGASPERGWSAWSKGTIPLLANSEMWIHFVKQVLGHLGR